jgi:hypothetical protein
MITLEETLSQIVLPPLPVTIMRLLLAFRAFFGTLLNRHVAESVREVLKLESQANKKYASGRSKRIGKKSTLTIPATPGLGKGYYSSSRGDPDENPSDQKPTSSGRSGRRSEAITLLAFLQRRAGLVDLIYEDLEGLSDEQIGNLARNVLNDTHKCLEECFQVTTIVEQFEGDLIEIPDSASPNRWSIEGDISSQTGRVIHPGWIANGLDLPGWRGSRENALVIAPVRVDATVPIRLKDSASQT